MFLSKIIFRNAVAGVLLGTAAHAGIPTQQEMRCPVGGETFSIVGTASCSTMGRSMSFRPRSSCEFVTALPVCPSNGLPVYRGFTAEEITELELFMQTDTYEALRNQSDWQRAYGVATHLGEAGSATTFGIMLNAFWRDPMGVAGSEFMMAQLEAELGQELERATDEDRPFLHAIFAYALAVADRPAASAEQLVKAEAGDVPDVLRAYIDAIRACQPKMDTRECGPDAPFDPF